ncbi:hypothetical protein NX059_005836 [Plenodomus lindquistii]|nr:hypothetical protein NX059_005836 [Plenodomus lindquistii]
MDLNLGGVIKDLNSMDLKSLNGAFSDAGLKRASTVSRSPDTNLLALPNEILDQIALLLLPIRSIRKNDGNRTCEWLDQETQMSARHVRAEHEYYIGTLRSLALTCRRLVPKAQNALFSYATLLQPSVTASHEIKSRSSSRIKFLRTLIERPDLRVRVFRLAIYFPRGELIATAGSPKEGALVACKDCKDSLLDLTHKLSPVPDSLSHVTEDLNTTSGTTLLSSLLTEKDVLVLLRLLDDFPCLRKLELDRGFPNYTLSKKRMMEDLAFPKYSTFPTPNSVQSLILLGANHHDLQWTHDMATGLDDEGNPLFSGERIKLHWSENQRVSVDFSMLLCITKSKGIQVEVHAKEVFDGFETVGKETAFDRRKWQPHSIGKNMVNVIGTNSVWRKTSD